MADETKRNVNCMKIDYVKITNDDFFTKKGFHSGAYLLPTVVLIYVKY